MAFNWSSVGSIFGGLTSALTNAGVSAGSMGGALTSIFAWSNPDYSQELEICQSILVASNNPGLVAALAQKLATEQGIPASALAVAMTLVQPGVDVTAKVLQIEQLIKSGG